MVLFVEVRGQSLRHADRSDHEHRPTSVRARNLSVQSEEAVLDEQECAAFVTNASCFLTMFSVSSHRMQQVSVHHAPSCACIGVLHI